MTQNRQNIINYLYTATGTKLAKRPSSDRARGQRTDYVGRFVFKDEELSYILTDQGRIVPRSDGSYEFQYFITDHLGNTRIVFNDDGEILQDNSYYPFGMLERSGNPATAGTTDALSWSSDMHPENKYLYNGKELQDDFGLDWYDYGARFYDPALARWHSIDPHAENYLNWTPYNYVANNPLVMTDPTGMDWYRELDDEGNVVEDGAVMWQEGSKEVEGYKNIGEEYTQNIGDGVSITYNQNEASSMNVKVLGEDDWETQREPIRNEEGIIVGSKNKSGDEGNCFVQSGKMVSNSGAESRDSYLSNNNITGTNDQTNYMNNQITQGNSVRVHVDYDGDGNGDHWVAISKGKIDLQNNNSSSYSFYDPGTWRQNAGTSDNNTFSIDNGNISGTTEYNGNTYIIINVRRNK